MKRGKRLKLLLDENIGKKTLERLRELGFDVRSVFEEFSGMEDERVLSLALREKRILVTLDSDFGALVFRDSKKYLGVLLLRLKIESVENISDVIVRVLERYNSLKFEGKFVVASEHSIRVR